MLLRSIYVHKNKFVFTKTFTTKLFTKRRKLSAPYSAVILCVANSHTRAKKQYKHCFVCTPQVSAILKSPTCGQAFSPGSHTAALALVRLFSYTFGEVEEQPTSHCACLHTRQVWTPWATCVWLWESGWELRMLTLCIARAAIVCVCVSALFFFLIICCNSAAKQKKRFHFFWQSKTYVTCGGYAWFGKR